MERRKTHAEYTKEWRIKNRDRYLKTRRNYEAKRRAKVREGKLKTISKSYQDYLNEYYSKVGNKVEYVDIII